MRIEDTTLNLGPTYACLEWLDERDWLEDRDWLIDMHGGMKDHTSFFFQDVKKAVEFKLTFG